MIDRTGTMFGTTPAGDEVRAALKRIADRAAAVKPADDFDLSVTMQPDGYFCAIDRNNYDVDCDHTGFFTKSPAGYGCTPLDAIVNLLDNTAEG